MEKVAQGFGLSNTVNSQVKEMETFESEHVIMFENIYCIWLSL